MDGFVNSSMESNDTSHARKFERLFVRRREARFVSRVGGRRVVQVDNPDVV